MGSDFGQRLAAIRDLRGLKVAQLAKLCKFSPSTVGRYESGEMDATWSHAAKLAQTLGVTMAIFSDLDFHLVPLRRLVSTNTLQLYAATEKLSADRRDRLARLVRLEEAPVTVEGWRQFEILNREFNSAESENTNEAERPVGSLLQLVRPERPE